MRARFYEPGKPWHWINIENDLSELQKIVRGNIEVLTINSKAVIVCNEEGKLNGMIPNRKIYLRDKGLIDVIHGPFLICGVDGENFTDAPELIPGMKTGKMIKAMKGDQDGRED